MTPFYFGTSERRLFGIYEPAAYRATGKRVAVLCHPWGSEYLYAHRTMRQLAAKLSAAGFHTLRFDFFGTGDSGGDMVDADLSGWATDVELAIEEIKDIVGATQVTLIGLRLGAAVSINVATKLPRQIDALVLWDPVVSGEEYLRLLGDAARQHAERQQLAAASASQSNEKHRSIEILGFPLTQRMKHDIQSIELRASLSPPPSRTLLLVTERLPSHAGLSSGSSSETLEVEFMSAVRPWVEDPTHIGMVPFGVIQRIVNWLG